MEITDVKAKIEKLFALAEEGSGATEAEIESALLMAKKLMFKYKISKADLKDENKTNVISRNFVDIEFSTNTNPWILKLSQVVADNYCCHAVMYSQYRKKTKTVGMVGFEDDVEIVKSTLTYAVNLILKENAKSRKRALKCGYTNADATAMGNAFGNGFVSGLRDRFAEQLKEEQKSKVESGGTNSTQSFALVMTTPQEVTDYVKGLRTGSFNTTNATVKARHFDEFAVKGYQMGKEFSMNDKLNG